MSKYLILGGGYLGHRLVYSLPDSVLSKVRIKNYGDVLKEIEMFNPEVVINCIGKTGRPNIDWCEDSDFNKEVTRFSNVEVPQFIHVACGVSGKRMVHISSGCIYEGDNNGRGFSETDTPNFTASFYSETKADVEEVLEIGSVLQLRIRMPLDLKPFERNLLDKLLGYQRVVETPNSITVVPDFLQIARQLIEMEVTGIYNVVNKGAITHREILAIYEELTGVKLDKEFIPPEELDQITRARRSNCVLSTKKLESLGIQVRPVREAVRDCIEKYLKK